MSKSIKKLLCESAEKWFKQNCKYDRTAKQYSKNYGKFVVFCREVYDCRTLQECKKHIQDYADYLTEQGYSASTIHTYLAPVCVLHDFNMKRIKKPVRHTAEYKRGRSDNGKKSRSDNDIDNPKYARTVEFQKRVGIRRNELKRLRGGDFLYDEKIGWYYVFVRNGKGGKQQKQYILPEDVKFVEKYFKGVKPNEKIFSESELENKLPYHTIRANHAKQMYDYYLEKLNGDNGDKYREELKKKLLLRYAERRKDKETPEETARKYENFVRLMEGKHKLKGKNKALAIEKHLPTEYDNLAVLAVSVFHLAHWRVDVTINSYLLAY